MAEEEQITKTEFLNLLYQAVEICSKSDHSNSEKISVAVEVATEFYERWCED